MNEARQPVRSFRDLRVWQAAMDLAETCYRLTQDFPREEMYGLTSQVRPAAVSIPANIAEGHGRDGARELAQFLRIARGSLRELETHLLLARRLDFCAASDVDGVLDQADQVGRMLAGLYKSTQERSTNGRTRLTPDR